MAHTPAPIEAKGRTSLSSYPPFAVPADHLGPLARRLAYVTLVRLCVLLVALVLVGAFYLRGQYLRSSFSARTLIFLLALAFALAGLDAVALRYKWRLDRICDAQLIFDTLTWTVLVYLTGGASSGATSFFGLNCLVGALLTGVRGATIAAGSGAIAYLALVLSLQRGWLAPPPDQPLGLYRLTPSELGFYVLVNLLVLIIVTVLAGTLAERLRRTRGELVLATVRADRAERMAGLGRLAAGLAHEIRNPLGSIAGSIQLLKTARGLDDEDRKLCEIIEREAGRLNDLVTDMMDLARPRKPMLSEVDVALVAREVIALAGRSGRAVSDVDVRYQGVDSALIAADGSQLRQLIWNLVRNAVQASSAGDEVLVTCNVVDARSVELLVSDHGVGIDAEALDRLFDAFFTTRSQGTGVGLAVVKRIADDHGFSIQVESSRGRGATFRVLLGQLITR